MQLKAKATALDIDTMIQLHDLNRKYDNLMTYLKELSVFDKNCCCCFDVISYIKFIYRLNLNYYNIHICILKKIGQIFQNYFIKSLTRTQNKYIMEKPKGLRFIRYSNHIKLYKYVYLKIGFHIF